jgi:hypothetical protein
MHRLIVRRRALTLMSLGLVVFSISPNLPTHAEQIDPKSCEDLGWIVINPREIDLSGLWSTAQSRKCGTPVSWQWEFSVTITKSDGGYKGEASDGTPLTVTLAGGSKITLTRDLTNGPVGP